MRKIGDPKRANRRIPELIIDLRRWPLVRAWYLSGSALACDGLGAALSRRYMLKRDSSLIAAVSTSFELLPFCNVLTFDV